MSQFQQTRMHQVYLAERRGDTLVVRPRGDAAGFSIISVNTEMAAITSIADSRVTKHLIVDLSGGNYFGSVVLGALVQLGNGVRSRGGRIALASASSDMQEILRLMKLEQMWELYRDVPAALRAIARIPFRERLWSRRKSFAWLLALVAVILLIVFFPKPEYGHAYYAEMSDLWSEVESRRGQAGVEEWDRLKSKCEKRLTPIARYLERAGKSRSLRGAERDLLFIARDHWLPSMNLSGDPKPAEFHRLLVQHYFRSAAADLEGRPELRLAGPLLPETTNSPEVLGSDPANTPAIPLEEPLP